MTPHVALHRDSREDIEGLAHRALIILPVVILCFATQKFLVKGMS